jgi:outer membrane protein TolC
VTRGRSILRTWAAAAAALLGVSFGPDFGTTASAAPLTLDEVTRSAIERYPLLAAAKKDVAIASAEVLSAEGGFDPALQMKAGTIPFGPYEYDRLEVYAEQPTAIWGTRFFGGWRYGRGDIPPYYGYLRTNDHGEVRAGADIPILRDGPIDRRRAALRRAEIGAQIAPLSVEQQKLEVVRMASVRYWDWVASGRKLDIARDLLEVAVVRDAQLRARVERGDLPGIERADNERAIQQRSAQLAGAQRSLENAAIELSLFLRDDEGMPRMADTRRLPDALPEPVVPDIAAGAADERLALLRRPEPKRLTLLAEQARVDLAYAENQRKLGLDFIVQGAKDLGPGDPKLGKPELELMLLVDVPLLNRVQKGRAAAAEATIARAALQTSYARDRVVADVRDAKSAMELARQRVAAARREVGVAQQLVELERQRFEMGEGTLFLVNLREQAAAEASLREVDALADFHRAVATHRAATGSVAGP